MYNGYFSNDLINKRCVLHNVGIWVYGYIMDIQMNSMWPLISLYKSDSASA